MPYTHFHDWSLHTHHRRPKGGNHFRAVRRRQRPWRIAGWTGLAGILVVFGVVLAITYDVLSVFRTTTDPAEIAAKIAELELQVHDGINEERVNAGGAMLIWDDNLASVARAHSDDMTTRDYFSHDTPEGLDPTDRLHIAGFNCDRGYSYGIAENIAVETNLRNNERTAQDAVEGWMNSPGHRKNLLNREYSSTGIGASFGKWEGRKAAYLTQVFC